MLSVYRPIESYYGLNDFYLSLPMLVDQGIVDWVPLWNLGPEGLRDLRKSAGVLKAALAQLDLEGT